MRIEEKPSKQNKLGKYAESTPGQAAREVRPYIPQWDYEPLEVKRDVAKPNHAGVHPIDPRPTTKGRVFNLKKRTVEPMAHVEADRKGVRAIMRYREVYRAPAKEQKDPTAVHLTKQTTDLQVPLTDHSLLPPDDF